MNSLGAARHTRGVSLEAIASTTGISLRHLKAIDSGSFDKLPPGIYARSYVRAFATAVQLDPAVLEEIFPLLPKASDPIPVLQQVKSAERPRIPDLARLVAAILLDAVVLLLMSTIIVASVAIACGVAIGQLVQTSPLPLAVLCATVWLEYFLLLAGVQGSTVGERICGCPRKRFGTALNLVTILRRTFFMAPDIRPELASS